MVVFVFKNSRCNKWTNAFNDTLHKTAYSGNNGMGNLQMLGTKPSMIR